MVAFEDCVAERAAEMVLDPAATVAIRRSERWDAATPGVAQRRHNASLVGSALTTAHYATAVIVISTSLMASEMEIGQRNEHDGEHANGQDASVVPFVLVTPAT